MREKAEKILKKIDNYLLRDNESGHIFEIHHHYEDSFDVAGHLVGQNCIIYQDEKTLIGIGDNFGPYESDWQSYDDMEVLVLDGWVKYFFEDGTAKMVLRDRRISIKKGRKFKWQIDRRMRCIFIFKK